MQSSLELCIPAVRAPDAPSKPIGMGNFGLQSLNLGSLIKIREEHETDQAKKGCRMGGEQLSSSLITQPESVRKQLIHEFHTILKEQQDRAIGTGVQRSLRWTGTTSQVPTGNAANAATVSKENIRKVCRITFTYLVSTNLICFSQAMVHRNKIFT